MLYGWLGPMRHRGGRVATAGTVFVIAQFRAKKGQEIALQAVLNALIPPTRREPSCLQYDLLQDAADPATFVLLERWETEESLDRHLDTRHVQAALEQVKPLSDAEPTVRRFRKL